MRIPKSILTLSIALLGAGHPLAGEQAVTIYNQNFAVVRDTFPLELKAGVNTIRFANATAQLEPDSVILRDSAGKTELQILEQNYRNDPVSEPMLLSHFEGRTLDFVRHEPQKADQTIQAKIVRSGYVPGGQNVQPIVELDGKLQFRLPGEPLFPALGDDQILKPTISWMLNAAAPAKLDAELAYVTGGLTWEASYNLVSPEKGDSIDFVGWITMKNESGAAFQNAKIKLMAGDVNKLQPAPQIMGAMKAARAFLEKDEARAVTEKAFDEFHLYTLAHPATLRDRETKQVEFVRASGVKAERLYIYDGAALGGWRAGMQQGFDPGYGTQSTKKVMVFREFNNSEANHLGLPLPKGRVRFTRRTKTGSWNSSARTTSITRRRMNSCGFTSATALTWRARANARISRRTKTITGAKSPSRSRCATTKKRPSKSGWWSTFTALIIGRSKTIRRILRRPTRRRSNSRRRSSPTKRKR